MVYGWRLECSLSWDIMCDRIYSNEIIAGFVVVIIICSSFGYKLTCLKWKQILNLENKSQLTKKDIKNYKFIDYTQHIKKQSQRKNKICVLWNIVLRKPPEHEVSSLGK